MTDDYVVEAPWGSVGVESVGGCSVLTRYGSEDDDGGVVVAVQDIDNDVFRIYPREPEWKGSGFLYRQVREIQLGPSVHLRARNLVEVTPQSEEPVITGLPSGMGFMVSKGLGLLKPYHRLIDEIEKLTACSVLRLGVEDQLRIDGDVFRFGYVRFLQFVGDLDTHGNRGQDIIGRLRDTSAANVVAEALGEPLRTPHPGRLRVTREMTKVISGETDLDSEDRAQLLVEAAEESRAAATENPEALGALREELNLVTLEVLIEQFTTALAEPSRNEADWQKFFKQNTFVLQQLFSSPVEYQEGVTNVKGGGSDGSGVRIVDFLFANAISRTVHVVEIKTPKTPLVGSPYRGRGVAEVFRPHGELAGAVAQVQSQMQSVLVDFPGVLKPGEDLDPGIVVGALIVGTLSALDEPRRKSFLRYRAGLLNVQVITYDEVLERLKTLREMLSPQTD